MVQNWTYTIFHVDADTLVSTDITDYIIAIPLYTDTGGGEINTALVKLDAENGKFITIAPIIDQFDYIVITGQDEDGFSYDKVYNVKSLSPPENKSEGTIIELELAGPEQWLQRMHYVGPRYFSNSYDMFRQIGKYYNENKGTKQPTLVGHSSPTTNKLPNYTVNTYDFGLNQEKCYNRMMQVLDKLGGSVESGGILDYFDMKFETNSSDLTKLNVEVFSSGSNGSYIIRSDSVNDIMSSVGEFSDIEGNNVFAWGGDSDGSFPVDFSKYKSSQQLFPLHPLWRNDVPYKVGAKVQRLGIHYVCIDDITLPPSGNPTTDITHWDEITEDTEFGDVIDYSPWTRNKSFEWISGFANQSGAENTLFGQSAWDGNVVIFDEENSQRTWVDVVIPNGGSTTNIPTNCLFGGALPYRGLRVLLLGTGTGAFAGDDNFGNSKTKQVLEYGDVGDPLGAQGWFVKFPNLIALPNAMVSVIQETPTMGQAARVYKYNGTSWIDISGQNNGNDCFHPFVSLDNVIGIPGNQFDSPPDFKNFKSAISIKYKYNTGAFGVVHGVPVGAFPLFGLDFNYDYYSCGAWLDFRFPYPIRRIFGISENVGYLFGSQDLSSFNTEPVTLDAENMNYLSDGTRGFNKTLSESYGQLSDISFFMKILYQITVPLSGILYTLTEANFKVRCLLFDTDDNVVFQDFTIAFNDKWEEFHLPLSGFSTYRGRKPKQFADVFIPVKDLDVQNVFIWRNIKQMCFQLQESYDSDGRYEPHFGRYVGIPNATDQLLQPALNPTFPHPDTDRFITLSIDAMRFTKPLLVGSGSVSDRDIEPEFLERPTITNYYQLQGDVLAELEKAQHRKTVFEINTPGAYTIEHGDTFYYINPRLVTFSDSGANTVKLVAKRVEYSITKPKSGSGGFTRKIIGVRRFV